MWTRCDHRHRVLPNEAHSRERGASLTCILLRAAVFGESRVLIVVIRGAPLVLLDGRAASILVQEDVGGVSISVWEPEEIKSKVLEADEEIASQCQIWRS